MRWAILASSERNNVLKVGLTKILNKNSTCKQKRLDRILQMLLLMSISPLFSSNAFVVIRVNIKVDALKLQGLTCYEFNLPVVKIKISNVVSVGQ